MNSADGHTQKQRAEDAARRIAEEEERRRAVTAYVPAVDRWGNPIVRTAAEVEELKASLHEFLLRAGFAPPPPVIDEEE